MCWNVWFYLQLFIIIIIIISVVSLFEKNIFFTKWFPHLNKNAIGIFVLQMSLYYYSIRLYVLYIYTYNTHMYTIYISIYILLPVSV